VTRLRVRWADGPNDRPGEGEALARLVPQHRSQSDRIARGGLAGPGGEPTDLVMSVARVLLSVETADGRRLVTTFDDGRAVPRIDDLRDAWNVAWKATVTPGRTSGTYAAEVADYTTEVDRRIRSGEPTDAKLVCGLRGWNTRTVNRHLGAEGFGTWKTFVAERRRVLASE
jgi:hypothetical protein